MATWETTIKKQHRNKT